jgi:hypothetical protein
MNADMYIDYVNHVEGAKRAKYEQNLQLAKIMDNSGVTKGPKYQEVNYAIGEYVDELEQRDQTAVTKTTQSKTIKHSHF